MKNITERIMKSLLAESAMHKLPADSKQPVEEKVPGNWRLPLKKKLHQNPRKTPNKPPPPKTVTQIESGLCRKSEPNR